MVTMEPGASNPGTTRYAPSAASRFGEFVLIVVIFIVAGPVVGTIVIAVLMGLFSGTLYGLSQIPGSIILGLFTGAAYVLGAIPAALAGVLVGIKQAWFGGGGWLFALGTGVLVGIGTEMYMHKSMIAAGNARMVGIFLVVATLSTLACWRIAKPWCFDYKANP